MTSTARSLPTKGTDAVEILKNDHTLIKRILSDLAAAKDNESRKELLDLAKPLLTVHNATEENLVYPALQKIAAQKRESQHLYKETAEADVLVFELDTMLKTGDDAAFSKTAEKLRDAVFEHIDDEETTAFPELREKATAEQTKSLTKDVREFRKAFTFQPSAANGRV